MDQSSISKYLSDMENPILLEKALLIAEAMNTNLWTIMYKYELNRNIENYTKLNKENNLKDISKNCENLIIDARDLRFKPWIGEYYCYFSSTSSLEINRKKRENLDDLEKLKEDKELFDIIPTNDHIFCAIMDISIDDNICRVSLRFMADKSNYLKLRT